MYFIAKGDNGKEFVAHATMVTDIHGDDILYSGNTFSRYDFSLYDAFVNGEFGVYVIPMS